MNMDADHHAKHHDGEIPELEQVKAFWRDHGTHITIAAAIVAVVVVGTNMYRSHRQGAIADASAQLAAARTVQDLEAVVANYGATPSAPLALLQLAKANYDMGHYNGAMTHYETLINDYGDHALARIATLGRLHCREAQGELQAAAAGFKTFADANPDHFLTPTARLGQARCLEQMGRFDEARVVFENVIATHGDSIWSDRAADMLDTQADRTEVYENPPAATMPVMPELALPDSQGAPTVDAAPIVIPAEGGGGS